MEDNIAPCQKYQKWSYSQSWSSVEEHEEAHTEYLPTHGTYDGFPIRCASESPCIDHGDEKDLGCDRLPAHLQGLIAETQRSLHIGNTSSGGLEGTL